MHLNVALLPPADVCEAVAGVVRSAYEAQMTALGGPGAQQLDLVPAELMLLPVASFGNVTTGDAARLEEAIRRTAAELAAPTVHLAGSAALEFAGDTSVWAQVQGDVDGLRLIPPAMTKTVESLGFFVDRRQFRPMLSVATITDSTSIEVLQPVVDALDAFRSEPWTVSSISLRQRRLDTTPPGSRQVAEIPLATG